MSLVEPAVAHGLHGALHRAMPGDEEDHRRTAGLLETLEEVEPGHLRKHEVGEHDGGMLALDEVERFLTRRRRLDLIAPLTD